MRGVDGFGRAVADASTTGRGAVVQHLLATGVEAAPEPGQLGTSAGAPGQDAVQPAPPLTKIAAAA